MDCFLNMLKRKNIDRVTVTDICEECGINRNTFYYYFSDIVRCKIKLQKVVNTLDM